MEKRLRAVLAHRDAGRSCAQALFLAYADSMDLDPDKAARIMEGFAEGIGGLQEICGVLVAIIAVISCQLSQGVEADAENRELVYEEVRHAVALFEREYGGITCRKVLRGAGPRPFRCDMKLKDAVLIVETLLRRGQ